MVDLQLFEPYVLGAKRVRGRFVIPSGIRCTHASAIRRCFEEIPPVGVVTTKSISYAPRAGYAEPVYVRYGPGCYANAVGLANPGAEAFLKELETIEVPADKFLLVSIFGSDLESFLAAARVLAPAADGFELNFSCPHAAGYGAELGQDLELVRAITRAVVAETGLPVFVKLSPMLAALVRTAEAAIEAGAAGLTLINTAGPGLVAVEEHPVLSNRVGGLSGDAIRPLGLRAVEMVRKAVGPAPVIIGMGGIAAPEHVRQYAQAGANLFGVGSALTGLDSRRMRDFFIALERDTAAGIGRAGYERSCESAVPMDYFPTRVVRRIDYDESLFKLILEDLPGEPPPGGLAGKFFFIWIPGAGEKPFAIFSAAEKSIVIRVVGNFTRRLSALKSGDKLFLRGPYGQGVPETGPGAVVHVGGGTGIASLLEIGEHFRGRPQFFLLGARTSAHLFDLDKFERLGTVLAATDDGSAGHGGLVTELIEPAARQAGEDPVFINCGPAPMVERAFEIERRFTQPDRIIGSIEYLTSCGVGICGKCATPGGALSCIDGPFLRWEEFQARRK